MADRPTSEQALESLVELLKGGAEHVCSHMTDPEAGWDAVMACWGATPEPGRLEELEGLTELTRDDRHAADAEEAAIIVAFEPSYLGGTEAKDEMAQKMLRLLTATRARAAAM